MRKSVQSAISMLMAVMMVFSLLYGMMPAAYAIGDGPAGTATVAVADTHQILDSATLTFFHTSNLQTGYNNALFVNGKFYQYLVNGGGASQNIEIPGYLLTSGENSISFICGSNETGTHYNVNEAPSSRNHNDPPINNLSVNAGGTTVIPTKTISHHPVDQTTPAAVASRLVEAPYSATATYTFGDGSPDSSQYPPYRQFVNLDVPYMIDFVFDFTGFTWNDVKPPKIIEIKNTSLQIGASPAERNVVWYSSSDEEGVVQLALKSAMSGSEFPAVCEEFRAMAKTSAVPAGFISYRTTMTGLAANTEYVYRVGNDEYWSDTYSFKTTGFGGAFSCLISADVQASTQAHENAWKDTVTKALATVPDAPFLILLGDNVDSAGSEPQYDILFSPENLKTIAIAPAHGNHDLSAIYSSHFNPPNVSSLGVTPASGPASGHYWYVYNNTLFMVLNNYDLGSADMKQFMQEAIALNPQVKWRVVANHYTYFSVGNDGYAATLAQLREEMPPIFSDLGIDVVLSGHDHTYMRTHMMDGRTPVLPAGGGVPASVTNPDPRHVLYLDLNSPTGSIFIGGRDEPFVAVRNQENITNFSSMDITDTSLTITTYRTNNLTVVDAFTIYKDESFGFAAEALTIQPGTDATALNFSWYSDRADNAASVVKIAKASSPSDAVTVGGVGQGVGNAAAGKSWHKASVTGLARDTEYTYRVSNDGTTFSEAYSFKTGADGAFQFVAVGDPQLTTGNQDADSVWPDPVTTTKAGWIDTLGKIAATAPNARFMAGTGDQVDTATDEAQYTNYFAPEQLRSLPVSPAVGNHEGTAPNFGWHFSVPNETNYTGRADAYGNYWYTYNNALFVVLNTAPYPANAAEAAPYIGIMDATLKAATEANPDAQWIFVQHHKSTASPASHQTDADVLVWAPLFNALMDKYQVDFVLAGHDHVYSRSWVIKDNKKVDADYSGNTITNPQGVIYFSLNTASGLKYYDFLANAPAAPAWVSDASNMATERKSGPNNINGKPWYTNVGIQVKAPQFTTVDVGAGSVTFKTYRTDTMAIIDEYTVNKTSSPDEVYAEIRTAAAVAVNTAVEYMVSLSALNKAQVVTVVFTADGNALSLNKAETLNGFQILATPGAVDGIIWEKLPNGLWQGTVKLMSNNNQNGVTTAGKRDVLSISGVARDVLGTTVVCLVSVEITRITEENMAHKFTAQSADPSDWEAVTDITERQKVFSKYDLNRDGRIDDEDLAIVWYYYHMMTDADPRWEAVLFDRASAKDADVNGSGRVDLADLIEVVAHYTSSYDLYPY